MSKIGCGVEYALHCLLWIADSQGVSPAFMAKIFPMLEKARIVEASVRIIGGYRLAKPAKEISVLDVVDAVDGRKALFECQEIREHCSLFEGTAPAWATRGVCGIHQVMIRAENVLRDELAKTSLGSLSDGFLTPRLPPEFSGQVETWFAARESAREAARIAAIRSGKTSNYSAKEE